MKMGSRAKPMQILEGAGGPKKWAGGLSLARGPGVTERWPRSSVCS